VNASTEIMIGQGVNKEQQTKTILTREPTPICCKGTGNSGRWRKKSDSKTNFFFGYL